MAKRKRRYLNRDEYVELSEIEAPDSSIVRVIDKHCLVCGYDFAYTPRPSRQLCMVCSRLVPDHIPEAQARRYVVKKHAVGFRSNGKMYKASIDDLVDIVVEKEKKVNTTNVSYKTPKPNHSHPNF